MLTSLAYVLLLGMALGTMASRLRLPSLVGMLLAGILLGPCVLNLLSPSLLGISADLRQLALVIILTRAGLSLELEDLRRAGRPAVPFSSPGRHGVRAASVLYTTFRRGTPRFFSSRRSTRASGSVCVAKISVTAKAVGSSLFPHPMALMMGTPAA